MTELAREQDGTGPSKLVPNPDAVLIASDVTIATADSAVLERCRAWYNLARDTVVAWYRRENRDLEQ